MQILRTLQLSLHDIDYTFDKNGIESFTFNIPCFKDRPRFVWKIIRFFGNYLYVFTRYTHFGMSLQIYCDNFEVT